MGYMGNVNKTMESVDPEGYLHSGDVGRVDENGMLWITGRIKELIITAGGENIAPVPIENRIKAEVRIRAHFPLCSLFLGDSGLR
jgi:long-chain-fatty-acid--CoA ligase ACSBG